MNDKVKQLLKNAEQSDAIARNKWRIENREQLREERKQKLKELMEKDKQQTGVEKAKELYSNIEDLIIKWNLDGYKTAGYLTRQIMELISDVTTKEEMIETLDESWEGCDGCIKQDEIMYKNGYIKGYNKAKETYGGNK